MVEVVVAAGSGKHVAGCGGLASLVVVLLQMLLVAHIYPPGARGGAIFELSTVGQ